MRIKPEHGRLSRYPPAPELARSRDYFTRVTGRGVGKRVCHLRCAVSSAAHGGNNWMITAQRNDNCVRNDTRAQLLTEAHDGHRAAAAAASSSPRPRPLVCPHPIAVRLLRSAAAWPWRRVARTRSRCGRRRRARSPPKARMCAFAPSLCRHQSSRRWMPRSRA